MSTLAVLERAIAGRWVSPDDAYLAWGQANKFGADLMFVEGFR